MGRPVVVLLAVALAACAAAAAAVAPRVIVGDASVGGLRVGRATPSQAVRTLGAASRLTRTQPMSCRGVWSRLGLTAEFVDLSTGKPCSAGVLLTATVTSRAAWRTALGLRVGDAVARLRRLYPRSVLRRGPAGYWLITRRTCAEGGSVPYPGLLARVRGGRVSALVVAAAACE